MKCPLASAAQIASSPATRVAATTSANLRAVPSPVQPGAPNTRAAEAHLQEIAQSNERVKAAGKRERREREQRETSRRRAEEMRMDAALTRTLDSRYTN